MSDVTLIPFYYEKGVECLSNRKRKGAAFFFKKSWDSFNITESTNIPSGYVDMDHRVLEEYPSINGHGVDESGFDSIEYGY